MLSRPALRANFCKPMQGLHGSDMLGLSQMGMPHKGYHVGFSTLKHFCLSQVGWLDLDLEIWQLWRSVLLGLEM